MQILQIFLTGIAILVGAIILNYIASALGLSSWYTFLSEKQRLDILNISWLFIIYPFCLGLIVYLVSKI